MNLLDVIKGNETIITVKDLVALFNENQIEPTYRQQILSLNEELHLLKTTFEVSEKNEKWTLTTLESNPKEGLFIFSETSRHLFVNYHYVSSVLVNSLKQALGIDGFLLPNGLYNNSKKRILNDVMVYPSEELSDFAYEILFGELLTQYNEDNGQSLLKKCEDKFRELSLENQEQLLQESKQEALNHFINNEKPHSVRFKFDYGVYFVTNKLNRDYLKQMFEHLNQSSNLVESIRGNLVLDELSLRSQYKRHLIETHYHEQLNLWENDSNLLMAQEIAKLKKSGAFCFEHETVIDCLKLDVILKGKRTKQTVFCNQPLSNQTYFTTNRYGTNKETIDFSNISKIFVGDKVVFSEKEFHHSRTLKTELDEILEDMKEENVIEKAKSVSESTPTTSKSVLLEVVETISKKNKIAKGQMAFQLW